MSDSRLNVISALPRNDCSSVQYLEMTTSSNDPGKLERFRHNNIVRWLREQELYPYLPCVAPALRDSAFANQNEACVAHQRSTIPLPGASRKSAL